MILLLVLIDVPLLTCKPTTSVSKGTFRRDKKENDMGGRGGMKFKVALLASKQWHELSRVFFRDW